MQNKSFTLKVQNYIFLSIGCYFGCPLALSKQAKPSIRAKGRPNTLSVLLGEQDCEAL